MKLYRASHPSPGDDGSSLMEMAVVLPFLLLLLVGAVDFGRGYYLAIRVAGAAHAAAAYGSQNITDTAGIQNAARNDAQSLPGLTITTASYGCECSEGGSYSQNCASYPTCATNVVYRVNIATSAVYTPLIRWPGIPPTITLSSTASMRGAAN